MSDARPDPLTPRDCDLRGMPYMPLDIVRLFDSDMYALSTGDEFKAALSLWAKSFLQVPAASLPTDERLLAFLSGAGARWPEVRDMALRGWVLCSDGRLYHPVVAEKAREAWQARLDRRARTEAARAAKAEEAKRKATAQAGGGGTSQHTQTQSPRTVTTSVTENDTDNVAASVTGSKGREGKGREVKGREESLREEDSVPSGTDADAAASQKPTARDLLKSEGVATVVRLTALHRDQAHSLIGAMLKRARDDHELVLATIRRCVLEKPHYPKSWLMGALGGDGARRGEFGEAVTTRRPARNGAAELILQARDSGAIFTPTLEDISTEEMARG